MNQHCWYSLLTATLVGAVLLPGCGSRLVEPGTPPTRRIPGAGADPSGRSLSIPQNPQRLEDVPRVPASSVIQGPVSTDNVRVYEVRPGDTLSAISRRYGVSIEQIERTNGIDRSSVLRPGQLLYVPKPQ